MTLESSRRIEQRHQTQTIKEDFREGRVHVAGATVPPRPALVERRAKRTRLLQPRLHQVSGASIWPLPLPPQRAAQLAPEPTVELFQCPLGFGQLEVRCP